MLSENIRRSLLWKELKELTNNRPTIIRENSNSNVIQHEISRVLNIIVDNQFEIQAPEDENEDEDENKTELDVQSSDEWSIIERLSDCESEDENRVLESISKERISSEMIKNECCICLDDLKEFVTLRCNHKFHDKCIRELFVDYSNNKCPLCREKFVYPVFSASKGKFKVFIRSVKKSLVELWNR